MMANQARAAGTEAMLDQPSLAGRAAHPVPAGTAQSERRIAPAIDEQHRLLAAFLCGKHGVFQRFRNEAGGGQALGRTR